MSGNLKEFRNNVEDGLGGLTAAQLDALYDEVLKEYAGRACGGYGAASGGIEVQLSATVIVGHSVSAVLRKEHQTVTQKLTAYVPRNADSPGWVDPREPFSGC